MAQPREPGGRHAGSRPRLERGLDVLDRWADTADTCDKVLVYQALFSMVDGSLFREYRIFDDFQRPNELFVVVEDDLVLKLRINCLDSFGILHIGPCDQAELGGRPRRAA